MKIWALLIALIIPGALFSQQETASAARLYYAGIVKKGPNWTAEQTAEVVRVNQEHRQYLERLLARGVVVLAGPFTDNGEIRGIYVFKVGPEKQARALCDDAPAVSSGRLQEELHPWQMATRQ
jgi:uncharacterized protein